MAGALRALGELYIDIERYDELDETMRRAVEESERTGERWNRTELLAARGLAATEHGALEAAESFFRDSYGSLREGDVSAESVADSCFARLRETQGRDEEAESLHRKAIERMRRTEYHVATALFATDFAEFLARRGRHAEARVLLEEAERVFASGGFVLRLRRRERIRALLATAAGPARPPAPPRAP